jgi:3',5'-cyclic AMP phosphodiesterase CpdA
MAKQARSVTKPTGANDEGRTFVTARLEISPAQFGEQQLKFARSLAKTLGIYRSDVDVLAYRPGCVDVDMLLPQPSAKLLDDAMRSKHGRPKELEEFIQRWRFSKFSPRGAAFSEATVHVRSSDRCLTWLHLSDMHIKGNRTQAPAESLRRDEFVNQLPTALEDYDVNPDVVFVTGDISYSAEPEQFEEAARLFEQVRVALDKPQMPIFAVPGNHDVHRQAIQGTSDALAAEERARAQLRDHDAVADLLLQPEQREWRDTLFKRMVNFNEFARRAAQFGQPQIIGDDFFYATRFNHLKLKIGVAGLNSAWRSSHLGDRERLLLSHLQVNSLEKALSGTDLRIALVHHPVGDPNWFATFDIDYHRKRLGGFDFILHGHEHYPRADTLVPGPEGKYHRIAAGALYTSDAGYTSSFNAVRVNLDKGDAMTFFWRFAEKGRIWVKDVEGFPRHGYEGFSLSPDLKRRIGSTFGTAPTPGWDGPSF